MKISRMLQTIAIAFMLLACAPKMPTSPETWEGVLHLTPSNVVQETPTEIFVATVSVPEENINPISQIYATVSPDGQFVAYFEGKVGSGSWDLFYESLFDSSDRTLLANNQDLQSNIAWAPDSKGLAWSTSNGVYTSTLDGYVISIKGKSYHDISWGKYGIAVEKWMPYSSKYQIFVWNIFTNSVKMFTPGDQSHWAPKWSPNGEYLMVAAGIDSYMADLMIFDRRGNLVRTITDGYFGAWSPNGREIAYINDNLEDSIPFGLWIYNFSTNTTRLLDIKGHSAEDIVWSPDGTKIAFVSFSGLDGAFWIASGGSELYRFAATPIDIEHRSDEVVSPSWIDNKSVLFTQRTFDLTGENWLEYGTMLYLQTKYSVISE